MNTSPHCNIHICNGCVLLKRPLLLRPCLLFKHSYLVSYQFVCFFCYSFPPICCVHFCCFQFCFITLCFNVSSYFVQLLCLWFVIRNVFFYCFLYFYVWPFAFLKRNQFFSVSQFYLFFSMTIVFISIAFCGAFSDCKSFVFIKLFLLRSTLSDENASYLEMPQRKEEQQQIPLLFIGKLTQRKALTMFGFPFSFVL